MRTPRTPAAILPIGRRDRHHRDRLTEYEEAGTNDVTLLPAHLASSDPTLIDTDNDELDAPTSGTTSHLASRKPWRVTRAQP